MPRLRRSLARALPTMVVAGAVGVAIAPVARAAEPIMPLADVHKGMRCTAQSVVSGIDIATFDIDVLDVVSGDAAQRMPYILFKASGAAIAGTGIGPGFSGSPITCPDASGTGRVIGAISEGIGQYGNDVGLATPIESILGEPVDPPASTRSAPALVRSARPLATPISVSGLSSPVAAALQTAAKRTGAALYAAPAAPFGPRFPLVPLRGGSAMAVGLASGDVSAGAIGTVAYVDGDKLWAFGHPLDGVGRRSLFLQDAYVYTVVNNPIGSSDLTTFKLAAPGHDVGVLTNDAASAVVGRLGQLPTSFPLKVVGTDLDSKQVRVSNTQIADEAGLGLPTGASALTQVGPVAVAEVAYDILQSTPPRQSGSMCVRIAVRERPKPLGFCNTYAGSPAGAGPGAVPVSDFGAAASLLDGYKFGPLHVTGATVELGLRRALRQAYMLKVIAPKRVRRGSTIRVRLLGQNVNGPKVARTIRLRVPAALPLGPRRLQLTGTAGDGGDSTADALTIDLGGGEEDLTGGTGPRTVDQLAAAIAAIHRYDGITASFPGIGMTTDSEGPTPTGTAAVALAERRVYRDPALRFSGLARTDITVVR